MILWHLCLLWVLLQCQVFAQSEDYSSGDGGYDDPLRRTLGLLGRIMNRMAQPKPPTDDQLHFTVNNPPDIRELSALIRQQKKTPSKTDRIINEELLQRLIPRVKGQTLPPRTPPTTTTKMPKTTATTTPATTTTTIPSTTPSTTTESTTTESPTTELTTTESTTTEPSTSALPFETSKNDDSSLIVRVKSIEEIQKSLEASAELNDEDSKNAQIVAEALRILLKEEGMNATKATERLREIAKAAIDKGLEKTSSSPSPTVTNELITAETEVPSTTEEPVESTTFEEEATESVSEEVEGSDEVTEETAEPTETPEPAEEASTASTSPIVFKQEAVRIPEAEEEELPTKSQESVEVSFQETGTTTTTRSPVAGQTVYNLNANANSASDPAISSVFTPVNAIVDGIGPLILPLIGYSRQALQSYYPRAQGANTYVPSNEGRPVQLRTLSRGYGNGNAALNQDLIYARGVTSKQQSGLSSLKTATNEELIAAFLRASQNNAASIPSSQPRPRYVPQHSDVNTYYNQAPQRNLEQLQKAFVQQPNIASYNSRQPQEIIGSTLPVEPTYYGPQIDRHIGQNILSQGARRKPDPPKPALPVEANADPAYAEGLKKVTAFMGDSGVMLGGGNANFPANGESSKSVATPSKTEAPTDGGFGGGRRPNFSFEDVQKNTEDVPSYSFLGK